MPTATTIVVAREDFSIPGGDPTTEPDPAQGAAGNETRFFNLLRDAKPDVVVLDLSQANGKGVDTILRLRRNSAVPILVVCEADAPSARDYRIAGATKCIAAPVDVMMLNQALQQVVLMTRTAETGTQRENGEPGTIVFAGLQFRPRENVVIGDRGQQIRLTSAESRLLSHLTANPRKVQSRAVLADAVYGRHGAAADRAIDIVAGRLRKKLDPLGDSARDLIKTEFRRGYRLVSDVSAEP